MEIEQFFDKIIDSFRKEKTVDDRIAMRALYSEIQGLFYMHVGYGPVMDSDNPEKVRKRGYGEYGRIYELYYINEGRLTRGLAAMDVPFYMQRLWDDDADNDGKSDSWISGMFNLSLRDGGKLVCDVVGAVNPALGMVFTAFDSMTFAALDMGFTGKSFGEAAADVGKRMAMSGVNWATKGIGSGASTGIAATTARAVATKYVTNVAESAVEATFTDQDYAGAYWDTASFSENYNSYISAGISAGLGEGAGVAYDLAVTGETKLNAFGMVEMSIGGSDGFSANWGTDGHSAGAVVGSTIGYLDSLGMVMSGWHTAEDNTQNANRLTLLSTDGEIVGKNLTEKEMAEMLAAQEEARRIAEEKEQEENLSDYDFDGTIGKNPQEYDFEGTIGKDKIELANKQKKQNNLLEKKSFFSNHEVFTSYQSKDGADALYADAGMNLDYENGNFNLNAEAGFVSYEKTWEVSDSKEFNFGFTGRASGIAGDAMIGMEGSLFGTRADMHVYKGGGTIDITLWGVTTSIGGDVMVGGIGGGVLLGKEGFKASLDLGVGVGAQVTWRKKK